MDQDPIPSTSSAGMAPFDDDDIEPGEYIVEEIVSKRKNPKTGLTEYLVKWKDYDSSDNTWEPTDHLKCPDLILKFNEKEKSKRKKRVPNSASKESQATAKKAKKESALSQTSEEAPFLLEDDKDSVSTTETISSTDGSNIDKAKDLADLRPKPKGFARNLPIEQIVGSCTDDQDRVWFFIKWKGANELDLIHVEEIENNAPRELCHWYRERLYHSMKVPQEGRTTGRTWMLDEPLPSLVKKILQMTTITT